VTIAVSVGPPDTVERLRAEADEAETHRRPLRDRLDVETTPADWKRDQARERLAEGVDLVAVVLGMQREYVRRQADTLVSGTVVDWLRE
jgi:hypothetical protein